MKSTIKVMFLGVAFMLFGIYVRCIFIGYLYNFFIELIWMVFPIIGIAIVLYGFFSGKHKEDLDEEIYKMLLEQNIKEEKDLICKKCGETYKEGYNSCPWCGHKEG